MEIAAPFFFLLTLLMIFRFIVLFFVRHFHPRVETTTTTTTDEDQLDENLHAMNILSEIPSSKREQIIKMLLPSKTMTDKTILSWQSSKHLRISISEEKSQKEEKLAEISNESIVVAVPDNDDDDEEEGEARFVCAICLGALAVGEDCITPPNCDHTFHQSCILEWLPKSISCPCCRTDMITNDELNKVLQRINANDEGHCNLDP